MSFSSSSSTASSEPSRPSSPEDSQRPHNANSSPHICHQPQVNQYGNPVSPLERTYPKPDGNLDISEALARKPLKHTFTHHVQSRATRPAKKSCVSREEMERRKRELLGFQSELNSKLARS